MPPLTGAILEEPCRRVLVRLKKQLTTASGVGLGNREAMMLSEGHASVVGMEPSRSE